MKRIFSPPRPRDPFAADYQHKLWKLEECVRRVLADDLRLLDERVVRYASVIERGGERLEFRELDAVTGVAGEPACVIEVKFRERGSRACRSYGQLGRSRDILRHRWPRMNDLLLSFWMAPVFGLDDPPPDTLAELPAAVGFARRTPEAASAAVCVDARQLLEMAIAAGCWSNRDTAELVELRRDALSPIATVNPPSGRNALNSLAGLFDGLENAAVAA